MRAAAGSGRWREWREVFSLALPSSVVQATVVATNIAVVKIVSPLGEDAVAAATTGQRLFFIFQAILMGLNVAALALVARSWGAGDVATAAAWLRRSMLLAAVFALLFSIVFLLAAPILVAGFALSASAAEQSVTYLRVIAPFLVLVAGYLMLAAGQRACGDARTPLFYAVAINVLGVILAWWLGRGHVHTALTGIPGAVLGLGLGNVFGVGIAFWAYFRNRLVIPWRRDGAAHVSSLTLIKLGYPAAAEQGIRHLSLLAFLWVVAHYGTAAFAAYGTGIMLLSLSFVLGFGFSLAASVLVGHALGRSDPSGVWRVVRRTMILAITTMTLVGVALSIGAEGLARWLVGEGPVMHHATQLLHLFAVAQPMIAIDFVLGGVLRGAGDTRWPMYSSLLGPLLVRFGLAALLLFLEAPLVWIYATLLADYLVKNLLLGWRLAKGQWLQQALLR